MDRHAHTTPLPALPAALSADAAGPGSQGSTMDAHRTYGRPLVMVDIDGVLNAFGAWYTAARDTGHLREVQVLGWSMLLDRRHPGMIAEFAQAGAELIWATMWQHDAWQFGAFAGFGEEWDYIDFDQFHVSRASHRTGLGIGEHKLPGIIAHAEDRPVVWIDDDITAEGHLWAERRTAQGRPTLFIQPDPSTGMTREHADQVIAFIKENAEPRSPRQRHGVGESAQCYDRRDAA